MHGHRHFEQGTDESGSPDFDRLVGRLCRRSRRTHGELKVPRPLRLPGMRLSSVVAAKAYPTVVG